MSKIAIVAAAVALFVAPLGSAGTASAKDPNVFIGTVDHVSSDNIKVSGSGQTLSFMLVPRFKEVFAGNGKDTKQMADIHNGDYVKVFYDQKALGVRHADKIFILKSNGRAMGGEKS
jgi:hypothetical protein